MAIKRKKLDEEDEEDLDLEDKDGDVKVLPQYSGLLERYHSSMARAVADTFGINGEPSKDEEEIEEQELEPLPQPEIVLQKHKHILDWMSKPHYVLPRDHVAFSAWAESVISERMVNVLDKMGFSEAFSIQKNVIPSVMRDSKALSPDPLPDVLVNSHTGSGKTLAYGIPIIEALASRVVPRTRALVLAPTRPLVLQVRSVLESLAAGTSLSVAAFRSDRSFLDEQESITKNVPDIIVSTPGRLVDHLRSDKGLSLHHLRFLVIDEADRLLNQNFQGWVDTVLGALPQNTTTERYAKWARPVQKLVFSATLTRNPGKLAYLGIRQNPAPRIYVLREEDGEEAEFSVPSSLQEIYVPVKSLYQKPLVLLQLVDSQPKQTVVFVQSNEDAARLVRLLELLMESRSGKPVVERCSGDLDIASRKRVLRRFGNGEINVLVCTDLIARGIDISSIEAVINYDIPLRRREYVHRVGRTARAGNNGVAYNLVEPDQRRSFWRMVNPISRASEIVTQEHEEVSEEGYQEALDTLGTEVTGSR